mmetsp:Transcript_21024/g.54174  ORF Transcript_21024/g.54174 Transcript_21024/m.54174 type:complete len:370 (-) Transcript_21024:892-2001(-)
MIPVLPITSFTEPAYDAEHTSTWIGSVTPSESPRKVRSASSTTSSASDGILPLPAFSARRALYTAAFWRVTTSAGSPSCFSSSCSSVARSAGKEVAPLAATSSSLDLYTGPAASSNARDASASLMPSTSLRRASVASAVASSLDCSSARSRKTRYSWFASLDVHRLDTPPKYVASTDASVASALALPDFLTKLSTRSEKVSSRSSVPPASAVFCERRLVSADVTIEAARCLVALTSSLVAPAVLSESSCCRSASLPSSFAVSSVTLSASSATTSPTACVYAGDTTPSTASRAASSVRPYEERMPSRRSSCDLVNLKAEVSSDCVAKRLSSSSFILSIDCSERPSCAPTAARSRSLTLLGSFTMVVRSSR